MKRFVYILFITFILTGIASTAFAVSMSVAAEEYSHHEQRAHIPGPYSQLDVALGVGISTAGIVVLNALTNTSVFGSAPFNTSFNPQSAPSVQSGAAASASSQTASASGGGGFLKAVGNFFKGLFEALRDMLTDEGRSYASGKVTDILSDSD